MKWIGVASALVITVSTAFAQSTRGTLAGSVTLRDRPVAGATVEAKQQPTGAALTTKTSKSGQFTLKDLPEGTYEVSVPQLGISAVRFVQKDVAIKGGQTSSLAIVLVQGNLATLGDDNGFIAIHNRSQDVRGPAPRTREGRPDLSGVWNVNVDPNPTPVSMLPWAEEIMKGRRETNFRDQPSAVCLPDDPTPTLPLLRKFIQTPTLLVELFEQDPHYRQIFVDGRPHPKDADPTWMGHAIGKWEKDTLVIDAVGFNDKSWLVFGAGLPHTEQLHIVERYRRPDLGHLIVDLTIEDPGTFAKPIERHMTWQLAPDDDILESICTENNRYQENAGLK